jgi:hypothetical protein
MNHSWEAVAMNAPERGHGYYFWRCRHCDASFPYPNKLPESLKGLCPGKLKDRP